MRRLFVLVVIALAAVAPGRALASAAGSTSDPVDRSAPTTTIDNSFLDTQRDLSECVDHSIELPGCGRAPTQAGDRGGALQLATFGILTLGIAFIFWRVARGIKARDAAPSAQIR